MDAIVTQYLPQAFAFIYVINSANAGGVQKDRVSNIATEINPKTVRFLLNNYRIIGTPSQSLSITGPKGYNLCLMSDNCG